MEQAPKKSHSELERLHHSQLFDADVEWQAKPNSSLESFVLPGVYLGRLENNTYQDEVTTALPDAGFAFGVHQGSHGYTGVLARPHEGYQIEAAYYDRETHHLQWAAPEAAIGYVAVSADHGNLDSIDYSEWSSKNLGNPGPQVGIIRVSHAGKGYRYFALQAAFEGEPDAWYVTRELIEIEPSGPLSLETPTPRSIED